MWMALASSLLGSVNADDANVVLDGASDPNAVPDMNLPDFNAKMPTPQQLLEMLDSMAGISDEDKASLKEDLLKTIQERASEAQNVVAGSDFTSQSLILLTLLGLVALIFVFFVYKLFKCLQERELKREEKKKNKQLKKKK